MAHDVPVRSHASEPSQKGLKGIGGNTLAARSIPESEAAPLPRECDLIGRENFHPADRNNSNLPRGGLKCPTSQCKR